MTSQINPYNINGAYPVAGQDNNSQGFRTNFTNTSTNFEYAAQEITDLQNNVVLKAALSGVSVDNNMNGSLLFNAQTQQMTQTLVTLGTVTTSTTINFAAGSYFTFTTGSSVTVAFTNPPAANFGSWIVAVTVASTSHTITFPASVTQNKLGIQGFNASTNTMEFAATGTYTFQFSTSDAGINVTISQVNASLQPFNNSTESLASSGDSNLALTTSYFTTSGTATLANGADGQIKVFSQTAAASMVVTVATAGWKSTGSGTITLGSRGTGCTLQYTDSKWFCIGNNGCTFA